MTLRTYRARSMADALTEVKKDLGRDAVILHTRSYKVGGWFGLGAKPIVEITASRGDDGLAVHRPRRAGSANGAMARRAYGDASEPDRAPVAIAEEPSEQPAISEAKPEPAPQPILTPNLAPSGEVERELECIRHMLGRVLHTSHAALAGAAHNAPGSMPGALFSHYLKMLEADVAGEIVEDIIGSVRDDLSAAELADEGAVRACVLRRLAGLVPVAGDVPAPAQAQDGRPLTIAMIGPTGVGKTTTVAKLAAAYKLRHARRVGLVTTDTYRIAAVEQLRTYANIIGVPLKVAMTPPEMSQACESLASCDIILLDSAGRSQNDRTRLDELGAFLDAAKPHQTHLLLACTSTQRVLMESARRFGALSPNRIVFTKLDEAVNYGVLLSVARALDLAVSYITTGQEVPDDIEAARADRLARLVLDGAPSAPRQECAT